MATCISWKVLISQGSSVTLSFKIGTVTIEIMNFVLGPMFIDHPVCLMNLFQSVNAINTLTRMTVGSVLALVTPNLV